MPISIIIFLAVLTQKTARAPKSSRPLVHDEKPITIEAVSIDWKWPFIYPKQGIATVNEIAFPTSTPVELKVTSNFVMNSFFIPRLGSQIYAAVGMQTRLHLIANEVGIYDDIPASYSGPGFSGMKFKAITTKDRAEFDQRVTKAKQSTNTTSDMAAFEKVAALSKCNQMEYFSNVKPDLSKDVINKFIAHDKSMDMSQPEGEYSAYEGIEGTDMSHTKSAH